MADKVADKHAVGLYPNKTAQEKLTEFITANGIDIGVLLVSPTKQGTMQIQEGLDKFVVERGWQITLVADYRKNGDNRNS